MGMGDDVTKGKGKFGIATKEWFENNKAFIVTTKLIVNVRIEHKQTN